MSRWFRLPCMTTKKNTNNAENRNKSPRIIQTLLPCGVFGTSKLACREHSVDIYKCLVAVFQFIHSHCTTSFCFIISILMYKYFRLPYNQGPAERRHYPFHLFLFSCECFRNSPCKYINLCSQSTYSCVFFPYFSLQSLWVLLKSASKNITQMFSFWDVHLDFVT